MKVFMLGILVGFSFVFALWLGWFMAVGNQSPEPTFYLDTRP